VARTIRANGGIVLAAIAVLVVLLSSGCGYGGVASAANHPDPQNGGELFKNDCGSCHTLAAANSTGTVGPNLDNAFAGSRKPANPQGYSESTIENVVLDQIRIGTVSPLIATYTTSDHFTSKQCLDPATRNTCYGPQMPANIVTGQDAYDVAAYVASVAGVGGYTLGGPLGNDGAAIFKAEGCGGCHTFKAADSIGTVGPNLDQAVAGGLKLAKIITQVTNGGGPMPSFKDKLTPAQMQALAQYILSNAGK
jgi:mono/diheme cytochrome c family protein